MSRRRKTVFKEPAWELERRGRRPAERVDLTDELVATAIATAAERTIHDGELRGLFVRIRTSGSKTYYYRQPGVGNKQAVNLGNTSKLSIANARSQALRTQIDRAEGRTSKFSSGGPSRWTVAQAFDAYLATKDCSEWSRRIERTFRGIILPVIGAIKLTELDGDMALKPFSTLDGYYAAGTPQYVLSAFLTWATFAGHVRFNVLRGRSGLPHRPRSKRYPVSANDIGRLWRACDALPEQWRCAFRLMIATGRPIQEVLSLSSGSVDHWLHDSELEHGRRGAIFSELLSPLRESKFGSLFTAQGKRRPMVFQQRHWNTLREAAGLERATMSEVKRRVDEEFASCRGDLTKWDDFLRSCMAESNDVEGVYL